MERPLYWGVFWRYRLVLLASVVVAVLAGIFSGFSFSNGGLEERGVRTTYTATTTVLLNTPDASIFASAVSPPSGPAGPRQDLPTLAGVYAYLVVGDQVGEFVQRSTGGLSEGESLSAERRTTQPDFDESNSLLSGRQNLPLFQVRAIAGSGARANQLVDAALDGLTQVATTTQDRDSVPASLRVQLEPIAHAVTEDRTSRGPAYAVLAGAAVLLVGATLVVLLDRRARRRRERSEREKPFS